MEISLFAVLLQLKLHSRHLETPTLQDGPHELLPNRSTYFDRDTLSTGCAEILQTFLYCSSMFFSGKNSNQKTIGIIEDVCFSHLSMIV